MSEEYRGGFGYDKDGVFRTNLPLPKGEPPIAAKVFHDPIALRRGFILLAALAFAMGLVVGIAIGWLTS